MRKVRVPAATCVLIVLTFCLSLGGQALDVPALVDRATKLMISPDRSDGQCREGLVLLLDAIVKAAPAARIPGAWPAQVADARKQVAAGHLFESTALLSDAYRAVSGKAFVMPAAVRSPNAAKDHIRTQLSTVGGLVDEGRADEAVRRMLEAALMVVTPVER